MNPLETPPFRPGQSVRFSATGAQRVRSMPEAWGLHAALQQGEPGEVVEIDWGPDGDAQVSVEFSSGAAFGWDANCFEPLETDTESRTA